VPSNDVICLSLMRWDSVYQRPQEIMSRIGRQRRVFFVEEPIFDTIIPHLSLEEIASGVQLVTPRMPEAAPPTCEVVLRELMNQLVLGEEIEQPVLWFYSPLALAYTHHLHAGAVVYDCMDELAAGSEILHDREELLLRHADVVFAARPSLHEARSQVHADTHLFVSPDAGAAEAWDELSDEMWGLVEDHLEAPDGMLLPFRRARQISTAGARATALRHSVGSSRPGRD
jgi:UDP-galactopyranose mutase